MSPQQFWFAEAIITKRFAEATKSLLKPRMLLRLSRISLEGVGLR